MKKNNEKYNKLIRKIKKGDKKAFNELYKLTSGQAYFFIYKIVQNEQDAEDILQETYIKMLEKIDEIDLAQNFASWFYQIAANKSKDLLRRKNKLFFESIENEVFDSATEENTAFYPEENVDKDELCAQVMTAIDELTAEKRACVIMKYYAQMSVNEIAQSLEIPVSTVKNRLFSARKDLKVKFEKLGKAALFSAAPIGIIVWALNRSSLAVCAAFSASAASAAVMTAAGNSAAVASAAGASTAATGMGVTVKLAAMSVAQKIAAGAAAAALVGGSAAGTVAVIKHNSEQNPTTGLYTEAITTNPQDTSEFFSEEQSSDETTSKIETELPVVLLTTVPHSTTEKATTNPRQTTAVPTTAEPVTTQVQTTVTEATTEQKTTVAATTAQKPIETTTKQSILIEATTAPPTTSAPAMLIIEVTDYDDKVVDTITVNVKAGTNLTWDYLIELVSQNGYEAMAGIYGDGVDSVAEEGKTYTFTAEL